MLKKSFLLAITGPSSSGKTYFSKTILEEATKRNIDCTYISTDSFYRDLSHLTPEERSKVNYDEPQSIDDQEFVEVLKSLVSGNETKLPIYDFAVHNRKSETEIIHPSPLIIVEGIFALSFSKVFEYYDFSIFVELDPDLRIIRRIQRDTKERGRSLNSVIDQYHSTVRPTQKKFVQNDREKSDIILLGNKQHFPIIDLIFSFIENKVK